MARSVRLYQRLRGKRWTFWAGRSIARSQPSIHTSCRSAWNVAIVREPDFWWRKPGLAAWLLAPAAALYAAVARTRLGYPGRRATVPVVCIGNLVLGGAGKTPTALTVAK